MKIIAAIGIITIAVIGTLAHEVGTFCQEIQPYAPEDYPRGDIGEDF